MLPLKLLWVLSPVLMEKEAGLERLVLKRVSVCPQLLPCAYILLNPKSHCYKMHTRLNGGFKQDSLHRIVWKWVKLRNGHLQEVLNGHKQVTSLGGEVMKWRNVMCVPNKELMSQVVPQLEEKQSQDGLKITLIIVEKKWQSVQVMLTPRSYKNSSGLGRYADFSSSRSGDSLSTTATAIIWRPKLILLKWYSATYSLFPVMYL